MIRKIIEINEELCNGCGLCAHACHEGAIGIVDGKAKLLRDDYCDGFGDCLPACPMNAIRLSVKLLNIMKLKYLLTKRQVETRLTTGLYRLSLYLLLHHALMELTFLLQQIVQLMPTVHSTTILCVTT